MARKSAALLKSTPVKLDKLAKGFLLTLNRQEPVAGCEDSWERHLRAAEEHEEASARAGMLFSVVEKEGGTSSCRTWPAYIEAQKVADRAMSAVFGSLDHYLFAVKHIDDKLGVPIEDIRATVIDSLADKLDGLTFSVNVGLLGAAIATAIRKDTSEESAGEPSFCEDCE